MLDVNFHELFANPEWWTETEETEFPNEYPICVWME